MTSLKFPLETPQLRLRPFERRDIEAASRYHTLPNVQRYLARPCRDANDVASALEAMRQQVALQRPGDAISLAMVRKGDDRVIGHVSLTWSDATASQAELRFAIDPAHSGQGYLTQAISAMLDLAVDVFRIHRVFVRCDGHSHHSVALMQKLGLRLEAHYREHALFRGEWDEELHFAILDREWRRSPKVHELPRRERVA